MARKRSRKRRWLRPVLLFTLTPLIIWLFAFLIWLYLDDILGLFTRDQNSTNPAPKAAPKPQREEPPAKSKSEEKILDEDRKKLDEIIKEKE